MNVTKLGFPNLRVWPYSPCNDKHYEDGLPWYCSRRKGHTGRHAARGMHVVHRVWA